MAPQHFICYWQLVYKPSYLIFHIIYTKFYARVISPDETRAQTGK